MSLEGIGTALSYIGEATLEPQEKTLLKQLPDVIKAIDDGKHKEVLRFLENSPGLIELDCCPCFSPILYALRENKEALILFLMTQLPGIRNKGKPLAFRIVERQNLSLLTEMVKEKPGILLKQFNTESLNSYIFRCLPDDLCLQFLEACLPYFPREHGFLIKVSPVLNVFLKSRSAEFVGEVVKKHPELIFQPKIYEQSPFCLALERKLPGLCLEMAELSPEGLRFSGKGWKPAAARAVSLGDLEEAKTLATMAPEMLAVSTSDLDNALHQVVQGLFSPVLLGLSPVYSEAEHVERHLELGKCFTSLWPSAVSAPAVGVFNKGKWTPLQRIVDKVLCWSWDNTDPGVPQYPRVKEGLWHLAGVFVSACPKSILTTADSERSPLAKIFLYLNYSTPQIQERVWGLLGSIVKALEELSLQEQGEIYTPVTLWTEGLEENFYAFLKDALKSQGSWDTFTTSDAMDLEDRSERPRGPGERLLELLWLHSDQEVRNEAYQILEGKQDSITGAAFVSLMGFYGRSKMKSGKTA